MAEKEDRTEEASQKRLDDAREKGDVARSQDFTSAAVVIGVAGLLLKIAPVMGADLYNNLVISLSPPVGTHALLNPQDLFRNVLNDLQTAIGVFLITGTVALLMATSGTIVIGGWTFSPQKFFDIARLSWMQGIMKPFSKQGATLLLGDVMKTMVLGTAMGLMLWGQREEWFALLTESPHAAILHGLKALGEDFMIFALLLLIPGGVDGILQRRMFATKMKMSKEEVKDEYKESEGNPIVKSRIRALRRKMAKMRMMKAVETATVVIVNPDHYAVALQFQESMAVPQVVAKGADLIAERIKERARAHQVPILTAPPLARGLYRFGEIGASIPEGLYEAVAIVLAYVEQLNRAKAGCGAAPRDWGSLELSAEIGREFEEATQHG